MTLKVELCKEAIDKERLSESLQSTFKDTCRLKLDKIEFVPGGIIPKERKIIVDERSWR